MHRYFNFFMVCVYVCNVLSVLCQIMRSLPSIRLVFQILHIYICIFLIDFQKFQSVYLYCLLKSVFVVNRCRCFTEVLYLFLEHTSYINIFLLYS